ncbi:MAG: YlbF family regulator [Peptococcaceae bacterium]|nr:YlbF family regulator [Peptococcaceae bacterium]
MLVHDKAHELARVLKTTPEFQTLKQLQTKLKDDTSAYKMFLDYRRKEIAYQAQLMSGQEPDPEQGQSLQKLSGIVNLNSVVREYIQAEARFGTIYNDIQRIIGDAIEEVSSIYTDEQEGGNN